MGMTIDNCINKLTEILEEATEDENSVCYVTDIDEPTLKMAVETMRKYQKIQNIICKWEDGLYDDEGVSDVEVLDMISNEVNGDGKID